MHLMQYLFGGLTRNSSAVADAPCPATSNAIKREWALRASDTRLTRARTFAEVALSGFVWNDSMVAYLDYATLRVLELMEHYDNLDAAVDDAADDDIPEPIGLTPIEQAIAAASR